MTLIPIILLGGLGYWALKRKIKADVKAVVTGGRGGLGAVNVTRTDTGMWATGPLPLPPVQVRVGDTLSIPLPFEFDGPPISKTISEDGSSIPPFTYGINTYPPGQVTITGSREGAGSLILSKTMGPGGDQAVVELQIIP